MDVLDRNDALEFIIVGIDRRLVSSINLLERDRHSASGADSIDSSHSVIHLAPSYGVTLPWVK